MKTREHRGPVNDDRTDDLVRHEAYTLWQLEGCPKGRELDHWLAAKEMVRHRRHFPLHPRFESDEEIFVSQAENAGTDHITLRHR